MLRAIVGTAGHIDHGKTRLIEALTGIDCDRWAEEKTRGITIDLGFAYLFEDDLQLGFIDVPGHHRFVHNALAGMGGIRVMLLVVAADEGVKPQTREHLEICSLLEIPAGVVALTKVDVAPTDLVELARLETEELLASTPFADAPILPVSAVRGDGIAQLRRHLVEVAARHAVALDPDRPARLPIDRAFHLKGLGCLITGTLISGRVASGDTLELSPTSARIRVRSIEVHGQRREEALAGERTSLQLTGVSLDELKRGQQLCAPARFTASRNLAARCRIIDAAPKPLRGWTPVRMHHFTSEVLGRVRPLEPASLEPGTSGIVELRLDSPLTVARGDRFILRRPSPAATLGGGVILDPAWVRRRGKARDVALERLSDEPGAIRLWVEQAGEMGVEAEWLARSLGTVPERVTEILRDLAGQQHLVEVPSGHGDGRRWLSSGAVRRVTQRAERVLKDYFRHHRLAEGMPKAEAVRSILGPRASVLTEVYLRLLEAQRILSIEGDRVTRPGRKAQLSGEESALSRRLLEEIQNAGLTPPSPQQLGETLAAKPQILQGVVRYLESKGEIVKLPNGLILAAVAVEKLTSDLRATGWDLFTVPQFKERFGLSRKWAIPLLEHLDSRGVTRRTGDQRQIVGRG